jgi:hypothetical protein
MNIGSRNSLPSVRKYCTVRTRKFALACPMLGIPFGFIHARCGGNRASRVMEAAGKKISGWGYKLLLLQQAVMQTLIVCASSKHSPPRSRHCIRRMCSETVLVRTGEVFRGETTVWSMQDVLTARHWSETTIHAHAWPRAFQTG